MLKEKVKPCTELSEKVLNEMYSVGYSPKSDYYGAAGFFRKYPFLVEYSELYGKI